MRQRRGSFRSASPQPGPPCVHRGARPRLAGFPFAVCGRVPDPILAFLGPETAARSAGLAFCRQVVSVKARGCHCKTRANHRPGQVHVAAPDLGDDPALDIDAERLDPGIPAAGERDQFRLRLRAAPLVHFRCIHAEEPHALAGDGDCITVNDPYPACERARWEPGWSLRSVVPGCRARSRIASGRLWSWRRCLRDRGDHRASKPRAGVAL